MLTEAQARTETARVIEVFSSIQGEGLYVGQPHLFVRFWDCNLACHYCDTDYRGPYATMTLAALEGQVSRLLVEQGPHEAVALTGGEPLLWWQFLTEFLPKLKAMGQRTYLETNGTLQKALAEVIEWVDVIAMDLKPPSATADRAVWNEHAAFLEVALRAMPRVEVFAKVVVTPRTTQEDLDEVAECIGRADRRIPCVLQPVTPCGPVTEAPSGETLLRWLKRLRDRLADVRVIPQTHPLLGVR